MRKPVIHKRSWRPSRSAWQAGVGWVTKCSVEVPVQWAAQQWKRVTCKNCLRTRKPKKKPRSHTGYYNY